MAYRGAGRRARAREGFAWLLVSYWPLGLRRFHKLPGQTGNG